MSWTRARIGQPRIKGRAPRSPAVSLGCYRSQLDSLFDLETHVSNWGTGTLPIPYDVGTGTIYQPTCASCQGWTYDDGNQSGAYTVSTANPPSGETYHLRLTISAAFGDAICAAAGGCYSPADVITIGGGINGPVSLVVYVGDVIEWSFKQMYSGSYGEYGLPLAWDLRQGSTGISTNIYNQDSVTAPSASYATQSGTWVVPDEDGFGNFFDNGPIYLTAFYSLLPLAGATFPYTFPTNGTTFDMGAITMTRV